MRPVSYTHLDVYKRQAGPVFFLRVRALLCPGAFERKAVARPGPHGRFSGFAAVSYTHLTALLLRLSPLRRGPPPFFRLFTAGKKLYSRAPQMRPCRRSHATVSALSLIHICNSPWGCAIQARWGCILRLHPIISVSYTHLSRTHRKGAAEHIQPQRRGPARTAPAVRKHQGGRLHHAHRVL